MSGHIFIVLAVASAFCGAVASSLARKVIKYCGNTPEDYMPTHYAVMTVGLLPFLPFLFQLRLGTVTGLVFASLLVLEGVANYLYIKSFAMQRTHKISVTMATAPVFGLLVLPVLGRASGTTIDAWQVAGIAVIVLGMWFMSGEWRRSEAEKEADADSAFGDTSLLYSIDAFRAKAKAAAGRFGRKKVLFPLGAAAIMGLNALLAKYLFVQQAVNPYTYFTLRCAFLSLGFSVLFRPNFKEFLDHEQNAKWTYLRAGFVMAQWLLMLYAIQLGNPIVANAAANTIPLFVLVIAFVVWKVRVRWFEIAGIAVVVAGVVAVTLA